MSGEPSNITTNVAGIYAADLLYEQNCKCGTTRVIMDGEQFTGSAWKIVILNNGEVTNIPAEVFTSLSMKNMSVADSLKLKGTRFFSGQEILGEFEEASVKAGANFSVIIYMDCAQS